MKKNILKVFSLVVACAPAVVMAIVETVSGIKNEERMDDHEARLAALEGEKGSE